MWIVWSFQMGGGLSSRTSTDTPIFVAIVAGIISVVSLIPILIVNTAMKTLKFTNHVGVGSSVVLSIILGIWIGRLAQM